MKNNKQGIVFVFGIIIVILFIWINNNHNELVLPAAWFLIGGGFLYRGFSFWKSSRDIKENGIKTDAQVIDYKTTSIGSNNSSKKSYYPIITFKNEDGKKLTQELKVSDTSRSLNKTIAIIYLKKGNDYEIIKDSKLWTIYYPILYIAIGLFIIGGGVFSLLEK
jgi:hypothetical protein